jgi:hypothetical protein
MRWWAGWSLELGLDRGLVKSKKEDNRDCLLSAARQQRAVAGLGAFATSEMWTGWKATATHKFAPKPSARQRRLERIRSLWALRFGAKPVLHVAPTEPLNLA